MSKQREELDAVLEALQNEMRETISKLDPKEMVWIHQPPNMRPILCKEPVVGAVSVCATASARKPVGTVTGWYGGYPVIEPVGGWMPAVGTVLYSAPPARKPLTDEEMRDAFLADPDPILKLYKVSAGLSCAELDEILKRVARAIERAHGIGSET